MSYEFGQTLLLSLGICIVVGLIASLLILSYPKQCFRLLWETAELISNPIDSLRGLLRFIAQSLLGFLFRKTIEFYVDDTDSIGYGEILILLLGISVLVIFQAFSMTNIALIIEVLVPIVIYGIELAFDQTTRFFAYLKKLKKVIAVLLCLSFLVFVLGIQVWKIAIVAILLLIIIKTYIIKRTSSGIKRAKRFEKAAVNSYKQGRLHDSFAQYQMALNLYKTPLLLNNSRFDIDRAKLLEKTGFIFYKYNQFDKALRRFHQALEIYEKPHLAENPSVMKYRVRVLKETATVLRIVGRYNEALRHYQLISQLTGTAAIPKGFFAVS
jgi:tetratricopeptide (TPR) repeat protein